MAIAGEPKRCRHCGGKPFCDIVNRDTIARVMEGHPHDPQATVSCCGLNVVSWCLPIAIEVWDQQQ